VTICRQREASALTEEQEKAFQSVAALVRGKSREGLLVSMEEIFEKWGNQKPGADKAETSGIDLQTPLTERIKEESDLRVIQNQEGRPRYYSSRFMSEAFARILVRKEGDPLVLIAETVRESSSLSSRPVPVATFSASPFHLSPVEISICLQQMTEDLRFQDIRQTVTSIGTCFLYSDLSLDPTRAAMLSEWFDVGQHQNP
jgi:hypothetical protein